jgi:hypothetical protein
MPVRTVRSSRDPPYSPLYHGGTLLVVQLGPLEVGVLVASVLVLYVLGRRIELTEVVGDAIQSFGIALRGPDGPGPTPT